ncbi:MAG: OB-fold domain-containing protein [Betaproteobacteria bacterium]|nr:OB-fold domain-containing protein [Betaproteobacteria bacterium]
MVANPGIRARRRQLSAVRPIYQRRDRQVGQGRAGVGRAPRLTRTGKGGVLQFRPPCATRVPYNVAIVELEEGPRLITNIVNPQAGLAADRPVQLVIEQEHGVALARFRVV